MFSYLRKNKFFILKVQFFDKNDFDADDPTTDSDVPKIAFIRYFTTEYSIYNEDKCVQNQFKNYMILSKIKSLINSNDE